MVTINDRRCEQLDFVRTIPDQGMNFDLHTRLDLCFTKDTQYQLSLQGDGAMLGEIERSFRIIDAPT